MTALPHIQYFLGANAPTGFYSLYDHLLPPEQARAIYILKGGPGCGKSTLMRKIGAWAQEAGLETEYILCSGDPDSLDALILPGRAVQQPAVFYYYDKPEQEYGELRHRRQYAQRRQADAHGGAADKCAQKVDHRAEARGDIGVFRKAHGPKGGIAQHIVGKAEHRHRYHQPQGQHHVFASGPQP